MELEKLDLSDPTTWTNSRIVDQFISDVLLPDKDGRLNVSDLYEVFGQYCHEMELGKPTKKLFGRQLSKRFQRLMIQGRPFYCCTVKPELVITD